jgi:hypothetical protein
MPQFGKQNGIKLDTKNLNPRIPDRKVPNLKIPEYKKTRQKNSGSQDSRTKST